MKKLLISIMFLAVSLSAHEKPWKVTGQIMITEGKPVECYLFCSLSLIQETFGFSLLRDDIYEAEMGDDLKRLLLRKNSDFLKISSKEGDLPAFINDISISLPNTKESKLEAHELTEVDVGIRLLFSYDEPLHSFDIKWLFTPEPLLELRRLENIVVQAEDSLVSVTIIGQEVNSYTASAEAPLIKWKNISKEIEEVIPQKEIIIKTIRTQNESALYVLLVTFTLTFVCWAFLNNPRTRSTVMLLVFCIGNCLPWVVDLSKKSQELAYILPEQSQLENLIVTRLRGVYSGTSAVDPDMLFKRLKN